MSGDVEVYVAIGEKNVLAGRMYPHHRRGVESASFVYNDRYLADPDAYALDPGLPLVTGTLRTPVGRALFGAFTESLPDLERLFSRGHQSGEIVVCKSF